MKTASDWYRELLPLLNGGRVELLDSSRLVNQLCALERRRARGGRETIDHPAGAHDDVAMASAMALVRAITEDAPALIGRGDIETEEDGPAPAHVTAVFATLMLAPDGRAGLVYAASPPVILDSMPLWIVDFEAPALSPTIFLQIAARLDELAEGFRAAKRTPQPVHCMLFVPEPYEPQATAAMRDVFAKYYDRVELRNVSVDPIEACIDKSMLHDPVRLHFAAAGHFNGGRVRFSATARARMATTPLGLTAPLGSNHDPLTLAIWCAVALQFEGRETPAAAPAWPGARMVAA